MADTGKNTAPDTALLIIDMINDFTFESGERMLPASLKAAAAIKTLRAEADASGVAVVYANDNFGQWHSERSKLVEHCMRHESRGHEIVRALAPREGDFFVIKPQFSGFYSTNLPVLLPKLGVRRLIVTGIAADICVLFTAADAHMRDYDLWVPRDAVASDSDQRTGWALEIMKNSMSAEIRSTAEFSLREWLS